MDRQVVAWAAAAAALVSAALGGLALIIITAKFF